MRRSLCFGSVVLAQLALSGSTTASAAAKKIHDDDVFALSETLASFPNAPFTSIDLSANDIENNGAKALSAMLKSTQTLTSLNLSSNAIGEIGGLSLASALDGLSALRTLNLNGNPIGDTAMAALGRALARPTSALTHVDFGNTNLGVDALIQIAQAMRANRSVVALNLENPRLTSHEDETSVHLGAMLAANATLRTLDLAKHRIRDEGVPFLVGGLAGNASLTSLSLRCNQVGPDGAIRLAQFLCAPSCRLTSLNLAGNRLIDQGGIAVGAAIAVSSTLNTLDLSYCSLGEASLVSLAAAVDRSTSRTGLTSLSLWGNHFTTNAATIWRTTLGRSNLSNVDFRPMIQPE